MYYSQSNIVVIIVSFIIIEVLIAIRKWLVSPVNIFVLYWYVWIIISTCGIGGLYIPSIHIYYFHIVFIFSFVFGSFSVQIRVKKQKLNIDENILVVANKLILRSVNKALFIFFFTILPYTLYLFINAAILIANDYPGLRGSLVSMEANPLFKSVFINYFYYTVLNGIWTFYALCACASFFLLKQKKHLAMTVLYVVLLSGIYFSRSYIYYFAIIITWSYIILMLRYRTKILNIFVGILKGIFYSKQLRMCVIVLILLLFFVQVQSVLRAKSGGKNTENVFVNTMIKYHTAGFVLFDLEFQDENSSLNKNRTYGLGMVGGIERIIALFIKQIDSDYNPIVDRGSLSEFRVIGNLDGVNIRSNALYNIVYTLVRDGWYLSLVIVGIILGYISYSNYTMWKKSTSVNSYIVAVFMFSLMTTSFIRSNLESTSYWICIFLLFIFSLFYKRSLRRLSRFYQ